MHILPQSLGGVDREAGIRLDFPGVCRGVDIGEDQKRFHVTEKGRVLVVPEMLGQRIR